MQIRDELAQRRRRRARRNARRIRRVIRLIRFVAISLAVADLVRRAVRGPTSRRYVYDPSIAARLYADLCVWIDKTIGWPSLPPPIGLAVLLGERVKLRLENLQDTRQFQTLPQPEPQAQGIAYLQQRTADGTFNALDDPTMGAVNTRFGRNVPNEFTWPDPEPLIMTPNPRVVSRELFTRDTFVPATSINMLVAAWIQFMTRDWLSHGTGDITHALQVQLPPGDDFPQNPMLIPRTIADPTRPPDDRSDPPTHINVQTAWWDGSQLYPIDLKLQGSVRTGSGGKLTLVADGAGDMTLPPSLLQELAQVPGWWLGLGILLTLFSREHNAICDRLAAEYPSWSDEQLFQKARLINAALMAKIHTVEWSPAIIAHPTSQMALHGNWWGPGGEKLHPLISRISNNEIIRGIPGTPTNQHSASYSMTEEFVAVYRMHPLIRDDYSFRRASDDAAVAQHTFEELTDVKGNQFMSATALQDLIYSFGTLYPGALQLHNYPRFLQHFTRPDGKIADLGSIDVLRMRELGVPRYSLFRELLHLRPLRSFDELTNNPQWAREIRDVYEGRLDRVDLMVGMFAEPKPTGFGFSDTAFRIFILMASRRLKSDRFFGQDFTPEMYTPIGMDWVQKTSMTDVLQRHYPGLRDALQGVTNAFQPWRGARA
ncbi:MAG: heme peroxidase [Chloroflexi bacterium]|nr:heme peroxidase [Chloroflexota bacterium]